MDFGKLMLNKEVYDEKPKYIKVVQTHISWVFLTGKYAYKIKKPVKFSFLDFSSLKKRKFYCKREFEINRKFSPEIYLDVLPITKDEKIKIKGKGKIIEYCLKMKELPQENLMSNLLEKGKIKKPILKKIAFVLDGYYKRAESGKKIDKFGSPKTIKFNWDENFFETKDFVSKTITPVQFKKIKEKVEDFIQKNKRLFKERIRDKKIKWCHGDLHSGNIFVVNDKPYIFDAIEFNERFACGDIANDIAFLLMDLEFRNYEKFSEYFLHIFINLTEDSKAIDLLDFYKCYRAFVRGKVFSLTLKDRSISSPEKEKAKVLAKKYFDLAFRYSTLF